MLRLLKATHASIIMRTSGIHTARVAALLVGEFSTLALYQDAAPIAAEPARIQLK
jgi:hypothetical protein